MIYRFIHIYLLHILRIYLNFVQTEIKQIYSDEAIKTCVNWLYNLILSILRV